MCSSSRGELTIRSCELKGQWIQSMIIYLYLSEKMSKLSSYDIERPGKDNFLSTMSSSTHTNVISPTHRDEILLYWKLKVLKSILLELVPKNSALSQVIYKHRIQNIAHPQELNWNVHLYTKLSLQELNKKRRGIRRQVTVSFFPLVPQSDCHNLKKKKPNQTYHIKWSKKNNETEILEDKKRGIEKDWYVQAIKNCLTICEEFVHRYGYYESLIPAPGHWHNWVSASW